MHCIGQRLYNSTATTGDIIFEVCSAKIPAHKSVLALASDVFQAMFYGPMKEQGPSVEIKDATPEAFQNMLKTIYTGQLDHSSLPVFAETLSLLGRYLVMKGFVDDSPQGIKDIEITEENVLDVLTRALLQNCTKLIDICGLVLTGMKEETVTKEAECNVLVLKYLLEKNFDRIPPAKLCTALYVWSGYECKNRGFEEPFSKDTRKDVMRDFLNEFPNERLSENEKKILIRCALLNDKENDEFCEEHLSLGGHSTVTVKKVFPLGYYSESIHVEAVDQDCILNFVECRAAEKPNGLLLTVDGQATKVSDFQICDDREFEGIMDVYRSPLRLLLRTGKVYCLTVLKQQTREVKPMNKNQAVMSEEFGVKIKCEKEERFWYLDVADYTAEFYDSDADESDYTNNGSYFDYDLIVDQSCSHLYRITKICLSKTKQVVPKTVVNNEPVLPMDCDKNNL